MATKKDDEGTDTSDTDTPRGSGMSGSQATDMGDDVGRASATFANPPSDDPAPGTHPVPSIGGVEAEVVGSAEETDTFRKPVVLGFKNPSSPANDLVTITSDQIRTFTYPGTNRQSEQLVAAAGTLTTRGQAEAMGLDKSAYQEVSR